MSRSAGPGDDRADSRHALEGDRLRPGSTSAVTGLHHVGHVTGRARDAVAAYDRLGFEVSPFEFPAVTSPHDGQLRAFGVGNSHIAFAENFIEIVTFDVPAAGSDNEGGRQASAPGGADNVTLVPLEVPADAVEGVVIAIERLANRLAAALAHGHPLQILVFSTPRAEEAAAQLARRGVKAGDVQRIRRRAASGIGSESSAGAGSQVTLGYVEIDSEPGRTPEGRIALAEPTPAGTYRAVGAGDHPNGAHCLTGIVLSVSDADIDSVLRRYSTYLGHTAQLEGECHVFHLGDQRIIVATPAALGRMWPGPVPTDPPGFAGCVVSVRDRAATAAYLADRGVSTYVMPGGALLVPPSAAHGVTLVFE